MIETRKIKAGNWVEDEVVVRDDIRELDDLTYHHITIEGRDVKATVRVYHNVPEDGVDAYLTVPEHDWNLPIFHFDDGAWVVSHNSIAREATDPITVAVQLICNLI